MEASEMDVERTGVPAALVGPPGERRAGALGRLAATWGLLGVGALLSQAIWRLGLVALEALGRYRLSGVQWAVAALWLVFMGYSEGYRGFQRGFSPRVVARALHLARHPRPLHVLLAPLFCMGLIHASRRRRIASWSIVGMVVVLVTLVRQLAQPWRGIIDAGVVLGLLWGLVAIAVFAARALAGRPPRVPVDLPEGAPARAR